MRVSLSDCKPIIATAIVIEESNVPWLSCGGAVRVSLERIVSLVNYYVISCISVEFSNFNVYYICKVIPFCIDTISLTGNPNIGALRDISSTIVPVDTDGVGTFCGNCYIHIVIAIEIAKGNFYGVAVCCISSRN